MTAYTDFHYSPTGSGVISGTQVLEQTEQGINGLGQYVQHNISGAIDTANQALTIAQTADSNATLALNTANSFASAISAANNTANNALTTAQSAQNTANAASSLASTANNNAATALNAANTATSNVATLTGTVNSLGNRMTTAENAISTNAGNITTLQTNLQTTNNNVTAAANAASSAQATATSAQSTATLARNQAYVLRYTGTTITGGGTIAYADIDNTDNIKAGDKIIDISGAIYDIASVDTANQTVTVGASPVINLFCDAENLIPAATDTYDLGSSSYQWNNLYAKNYYYNGTAWGLDKANVWTGSNSFKNITLSTNAESVEILHNTWHGYEQYYTRGTSNYPNYDTFLKWNSTKYDNTLGLFKSVGVLTSTTEGATVDDIDETFAYYIYHINAKYVDFMNNVRIVNDGTSNILAPISNGTTELGTSTSKWKTLNGINPGALSLPDNSKQLVVDTTDWNITGGTNVYTPPANGWLHIRVSGATELTVRWNDWRFGDRRVSATATDLGVTIPVVAGTTVDVVTVASGFVNKCTFFPCLGNV